MKKTLITLAALAASVASAAELAGTLDFNTAQNGDTITFTTPVNGGWDADTDANKAVANANKIVLTGATTLTTSGNSSSFVSGDKTVTVTNDGPMFNGQGSSAGGAFAGGTIDFGTSGKLTTNEQFSLLGMNLAFTATRDFTIETDDSSLWGETVLIKEELLVSSGVIWYRGMTNGSYTFTLNGLTSDGVVINNMTAANFNGMSLTLNDESAAGSWQLYNGDGADDISIAYVAKYVAAPSTPAVPEPTTATLSLLALAGLAARRRRK